MVASAKEASKEDKETREAELRSKAAKESRCPRRKRVLTLSVPVSATVIRQSTEDKFGIVLNKVKGSNATEVHSINSGSPFAGTALRAGMHIQSVNGVKVASRASTLKILRPLTGKITVVAYHVDETGKRCKLTGPWAEEEHRLFLQGLEEYGKEVVQRLQH